MMIKKRKIIQIIPDAAEIRNTAHPLIALCDDGSIWQLNGSVWLQLDTREVEYLVSKTHPHISDDQEK